MIDLKKTYDSTVVGSGAAGGITAKLEKLEKFGKKGQKQFVDFAFTWD